MAPVVSSVDVARPPEEVFPYVTDPSLFAEWQEGVVSGHAEGDGSPSVGTRYTTVRLIRGADQAMTSEITEINPPRSWAVRGIDGPVRANVNVGVDPLNGGTQSRVTITVDFVGHGMGKALIPFIVQQARKEAPRNCRSLKRTTGGPAVHDDVNKLTATNNGRIRDPARIGRAEAGVAGSALGQGCCENGCAQVVGSRGLPRTSQPIVYWLFSPEDA